MSANNSTTYDYDPIFVKVHGIFSCESFWDCNHSVFLVLTAAVSVFLFARAYVIISKDQGKRLDRLDYILFMLALVQVMLVFLTKAAYDSPFWTFTLRALALYQNIIICSICSYYYFEEEDHPGIQRITILGIIVASIMWLYSLGADTEDATINVCQQVTSLTFASMSLGVSVAALWFSYHSIKFINTWIQEVYKSAEGTEIELRRANLERIKGQILVLMLGVLLSSGFQFIWDLYKLWFGQSNDACHSFFHPGGVMSFLSQLVHDIVCLLVPSWAIYYIYYWRDRDSFEVTPQPNETELLLRNQ